MQSIDILVFEDNEGNITTKGLQEHKIVNKIQTVKIGMEAMIYLLKKDKYEKAHMPHLVLLNIKHIKLFIHEVLKELRSQVYLRLNQMVISNSCSSARDTFKSTNYDDIRYITKTIDVNQFLRRFFFMKELGLTRDQTFNS